MSRSSNSNDTSDSITDELNKLLDIKKSTDSRSDKSSCSKESRNDNSCDTKSSKTCDTKSNKTCDTKSSKICDTKTNESKDCKKNCDSTSDTEQLTCKDIASAISELRIDT